MLRSNNKLFIGCSLLITSHMGLADPKLKTVELSNQYPIHKDQLSLSGFSAGATFANLFHIIHSKLFVGVGIFAGLYYNLHKGLPLAREKIKSYEKSGLIDKFQYIENDKVFIWAGTNDTRYRHNIYERLSGLVQIYEPILKSPLQLYTRMEFSPHRMPTGFCDSSRNSNLRNVNHSANIAHCFYDGHFHMFRFFYGQNFLADNCSTNPCDFSKNLYIFDQTKYFPRNQSSGMAKKGLIYIPEKCQNSTGQNKCYLHLNFHGCKNGAWKGGRNINTTIESVQDKTKLNILSLAQKNNVIVVFPICVGCFINYGGRKEKDYDNKKGIKVRIIRRIVKELTGI